MEDGSQVLELGSPGPCFLASHLVYEVWLHTSVILDKLLNISGVIMSSVTWPLLGKSNWANRRLRVLVHKRELPEEL